MTAQILDGRELAVRVRRQVSERVARFTEKRGRAPGLEVILVGDDPASAIYTRNKEKASRDVGMRGHLNILPRDIDEPALIALIQALNADESVDGILVQLPLPPHISSDRVLATIRVEKDVEGFHPENVGLRSLRRPCVLPCTPVACMKLISEANVSLRGAEALVVGCSPIVGKPMADLLLAAEATVTIAHAATRALSEHVSRAEVLVVATGNPGLIRGQWIRRGAVVIDVGINRETLPSGETRLVGDVAFDEAKERASAITPVPGGVGPMTIASLLENTMQVAEGRLGL